MKRRFIVGPVVAAAVALTATACGGGAPDAGGAAPDGPVKVKFAGQSVGQNAYVILAQEKGIFAKHGIDLEISFIQPPAIVPSLLGGDADFAWHNAPGVLAARGNDVAIKAVSTTSVAGDDPATFPIQVMVPKDSAIKTPADLVGKQVATASLFQLPDLALIASLDKAGVDGQAVKFVEVPFPNMAQSLSSGQVDAIISTEPFVSIIKASGAATSLGAVTEGLSPTSPISVIASSEKFINEKPDVVANFRAALDEATEYANAHDDEVRATIPKITELKPEVAAKISLAPIATTDDAEDWETWAQLLVDVGALDEKPNSADAFLAD